MTDYTNSGSVLRSRRTHSEMGIDIWGATDKGLQREGNEDWVYPCSIQETIFPSPIHLEQKGRLLIVADGVGGASAGAEASRWAIRVAVERYYDLNGASIGENLRTAIQIANTSLSQYISATGVREAGTTMAAAVVCHNRLHIASVGDSRVYLFRGDQLLQQTVDHTLAQRKIDQGIIRPDQADTDPDQSVLTRSMGTTPLIDVDLLPPRQLQSGDVVLLCSDGLTDMLSDRDIAQFLSSNSPRRTAQKLIRAANRAGGFDNISVIIAQVSDRHRGSIAGSFFDRIRAVFGRSFK